MPRRVLRAALALALLASGPGASAEVYRWTDADGRLHFTQDLGEVPPGQREAARDAAAAPDRPGTLQTYRAPEPAPRRAPRRGSVLRIPFAREGHAMLVEVRVNDRVTAPFLVDTGASDVAIPRWVADRAGCGSDRTRPAPPTSPPTARCASPW